MAVPKTDYEAVAASQTAQQLGPVGGLGDVLERVVVNVTTSATSQVTIIDGDQSMVIVPANTPIGSYSIAIGARARVTTTPGWKITTAAGVSVVAVGRFT